MAAKKDTKTPPPPPEVISDPTGVYVRVPLSQDLLQLAGGFVRLFDEAASVARSIDSVHKRLTNGTGKKKRRRR